jgi:hypothetical protein
LGIFGGEHSRLARRRRVSPIPLGGDPQRDRSVGVGVLAANGGRCPLSDLAARYTDERASNFDIYLPNWLASRNKTIFGTLFVVNELIVLWCWRKRARLSSDNDGGTL